MSVAYGLSDASDSGGFVAFKVSQYLYDFIDARVVNIDIIQRHQEGLKIPIKCLKDFKTGKDYAYVALLKANQASFRKVRILAANEIYAIIESYDPNDPDCKVNVYDTYLRNIENLDDGMVLVK
jgi:hypothetical protein